MVVRLPRERSGSPPKPRRYLSMFQRMQLEASQLGSGEPLLFGHVIHPDKAPKGLAPADGPLQGLPTTGCAAKACVEGFPTGCVPVAYKAHGARPHLV